MYKCGRLIHGINGCCCSITTIECLLFGMIFLLLFSYLFYFLLVFFKDEFYFCFQLFVFCCRLFANTLTTKEGNPYASTTFKTTAATNFDSNENGNIYFDSFFSLSSYFGLATLFRIRKSICNKPFHLFSVEP